MKQGDTYAIIKMFQTGNGNKKRVWKEMDYLWITGTERTHSSICPKGCVIIGKPKDTIGQGHIANINDLKHYVTLEL